MTAHDRRLHAFRADLADAALRGQVEAARFVAPSPHYLAVPLADLHREPRADAEVESQALFGETVQVFDTADGWAWVQLEEDGYVGYLPAAALKPGQVEATHRVWATSTPLFPQATLKAPTERFLYFWSQVRVIGESGRYAEVEGGGWLWKDHLRPLAAREPDYVKTAQRFIEAPYLWGGKSSRGLDCSALQQLALRAAGHSAARDSDMQWAEGGAGLGQVLAPDSPRQRGDLLFWQGHCAIALDAQQILNATAGHLATVIEPFDEIDGRARQDSPEGLLGLRRLA